MYQLTRHLRKTIRSRQAVLGRAVLGLALAGLAVPGLTVGLAAGCDGTGDRAGGTASTPPPTAAPSPLRIVSLSPAVSSLLLDLGAGPEIVATDGASRGLAGLGSPVDLGSLQAAAVPVVASLAPDLALGLADDGVLPFAERLREAGLRVVLLEPRSANEVDAAVQRVGALVGREMRARSVAAGIARDVARIATRRDGRSRLRVAMVVACDPMRVVGGAGLVHETLELAGAENVFHEPDWTIREIAPKEMAERAPEVVLDASGRGPGSRCFDPSGWGAEVRPVPTELTALPALDLLPRVETLYALLYERDT